MENRLQEMVNEYGLGISKEKLVELIYWNLKAERIEDVVILNEKYLIVEGQEYQLIKSKKLNSWIVKKF